MVAGCWKKTKNSAESRRTGREEEPKGGGPTSKAARETTVRREGGENLSSWTYQGSLQGKVARRHQKRVDSHSKSVVKASSGLMHLAREMYRDVTDMETVEIPDEFFDKTFIRHLMLGGEKTRRENVLVHLHENFAKIRFEGTRYKGDADIYIYGAMKYLTNLRNRLTVHPERFMIRAVFALYPGLSRDGKWAIINGITKDRKREDEVEIVDKKASN